MIRKYHHFFALCFMSLLVSCSNEGEKVEASESKTPTIVKALETRTFDKVKEGSTLSWRASHFGGLDPRNGSIDYQEARITIDEEKIVSGEFFMDMDKLRVENLPEDAAKELTEHLKSDDFFSISKFPISKFEITSIDHLQEEYNSEITGNLSILGISKSITFKARIVFKEEEISIKSEDFIIDRSDWGMTYNAKGTAGVPLDYLISDEVGFTIDIIVTK